MKRIALISEHASPLALLNGEIGGVDAGGQNIYVAHVARQLGLLGHTVDVFTRREDPEMPECMPLPAASGVRVIHVPAGPPRVLPKERLLAHMPAFSAWMLDFCRRQRRLQRGFEVVHANFFMSGMAGLRMQRELGLPLVMTFHALGRIRRLHQGAGDGFPDQRFAIEEELVRCADRIVAECPQDCEDLLGHYAADPRRLDTVPCGFDAAEFFPTDRGAARRALGWKPGVFSALQLGRMVPRKGIDNVILGVAQLCRQGADACLYVVGGNSAHPDEAGTPEIARLRAVAREAGIADKVVFTGRRGRAQLRLFYSAADVFVTTPWYEPFGITPVEAMACACPVIGSAVGGIRSTVDDGVTGFLVPPRDPHALAARLAVLWHDPRRAAAMGRAGLSRARRDYTWAGVARSLETVYARACGDAARAAVFAGVPPAGERRSPRQASLAGMPAAPGSAA